MSSLREFVSKELVPSIVADAKALRIFNEADLQYRTAHHIDQKYVKRFSNIYLLNQPYIRIGKGPSTVSAKPDLVLVDTARKPITAFELKCFLENPSISTVVNKVWEDIENLGKIKQRYPDTEYAFAIVLVDVADTVQYEQLVKEFKRQRESWMAHYLRIHLINMYCDENLRKRNRYDAWAELWLSRQLKN